MNKKDGYRQQNVHQQKIVRLSQSKDVSELNISEHAFCNQL